MAFHHTLVLPYDLDSRDARWPAVALNVSSLFGCGFVQQKKIIIPHSGTKYFFWTCLSMGHKVVAAYIDRKRKSKQK